MRNGLCPSFAEGCESAGFDVEQMDRGGEVNLKRFAAQYRGGEGSGN